MKTTIKLLTLAAVFTALVTSCEDVQTVVPVPNTNSSNLTSNFLFINASPDAPALNLYVNNVLLDTAITLGGAKPYKNVAVTTNGVGSNTSLHVKANTGTIGGVLDLLNGDQKSTLIYRATNISVNNFSAAAGGYYTLIVVDTINRPKPLRLSDSKGNAVSTYYAPVTSFKGKDLNGNDTTIVLSGNNSQVIYDLVKRCNSNVAPSFFVPIGLVPLGSSDVGGPRFLMITDYLPLPATSPAWPVPTTGKFAVRFIHAAPDAGTATCKINSVSMSSGQFTYPLLQSNFNPTVGSRSTSGSSPFTVGFANNFATSGTYDIAVTVGATTITLPAQDFASNGIYTVVLTGSVAKGTLSVTLVKNK